MYVNENVNVIEITPNPASENNKTTVPTDKPQSLFWVAGWVLHEREEGQAIQFLGQLCVHALHKLGLQSK